MHGTIALIACSFWVLWSTYRDRRTRHSDSMGIWIVIVWVLIHATRPLSIWLNINTGAISRDEGSLFDAMIDLLLICSALALLMHRGIRWSQVVRENGWLLAFYLFWVLSISWSDYPFITFKRVIRDLGSVWMMLVVLTESDQAGAIRTVCLRVAYICIPLSVVLIRYYPNVGRSLTGYDRSFQMPVGVATHKNSLGMLAMVAALFILWELLERFRQPPMVKVRQGMVADVLMLGMAWYLLAVANSATSLVCMIAGSILIIIFRSPTFLGIRRRLEIYAMAGIACLATMNLTLDIKSAFFESVGRNETLTNRTEMWPIFIDLQPNALFGTGFDTFWAGRRLEQLPDDFRSLTQAHNGYLETYLNGGVVGVTLLVIVLLSAYWRARKRLVTGTSEWCMKMVIILVVVAHNFSEASFNKMGLLWFVMLFAIMVYSRTGDTGSRTVASQSKSSGRIAHASTL